MELFLDDWRAGNVEAVTEEVPAEAKARSVYVPENKDLALLLEKDVRWTQDAGFVDSHLGEAWEHYESERFAILLSIPCTFLEVLKIGLELFSAYVGLGTRLEPAIYWVQKAQVACADVSVQVLMTELKVSSRSQW